MNIEIIGKFIEVYILHHASKKILVLKRAKGLLYEDSWQPITAKINKGETAVDTAIRETKEETQCPIQRLFNIDTVNRFYYPKNNEIYLIPTFCVYTNQLNVILSDEHVDYKWLEIHNAMEMLLWQSQKNALMQIELDHIRKPQTLKLKYTEISCP